MVAEVGVEQNTTTILLLPSDFMTLANAAAHKFNQDASRQDHPK